MKYIKKQDIIDTIEKFKAVREKKKNCSNTTAVEYAMFNYFLKIIDTLDTIEVEGD